MYDARHEYPPGQRDYGCLKHRAHEEGCADHADVEQARGEGGQGEAAEGVEHAAGIGEQADEEEVGEGDAQHVGGQFEARRFIDEAGGKKHDQERAEHDSQGADN